MLLFFNLYFILLNVIEAKLETYVIRMKNPAGVDALTNKREHQWSAVYYMAVCGIVCVHLLCLHLNPWLLIPLIGSLLINRRVFFDTVLKWFRKRSLKTIEGDQPLDNMSRKIFGDQGGIMELSLLVLALTTILIIFQF